MAKSDKRDTERARRRVMVRYGVASAQHRGFTKDLSSTGMFIRTNKVFVPDTTIQVEIQFPDRTFSMWARVIWAKKVPPQLAHILECGMGICFIDPQPDWLDYFSQWKPG